MDLIVQTVEIKNLFKCMAFIMADNGLAVLIEIALLLGVKNLIHGEFFKSLIQLIIQRGLFYDQNNIKLF